MSLDLQTAHISRIGGRRRNEDSCAYWSSDAGCCWVVSDGAGGHGSGDVASRLVVNAVIESFSLNPVVSSENVARLLEAAQTAVVEAKQASPGGDDMYATCVLLLIDRKSCRAVWGHAGDSRLYLFRAGKLCYQTRDHSLVQNMIDAGYGSAEMSRTHPNRNLLTSAIGNPGDLEITVSDDALGLSDGDAFLLCSDGWWEYVHEDRMVGLLDQARPVQAWIEDMAGVVEREARSGNDNYTAIGVAVGNAGNLETGPVSVLEDEITVLLPSGKAVS